MINKFKNEDISRNKFHSSFAHADSIPFDCNDAEKKLLENFDCVATVIISLIIT